MPITVAHLIDTGGPGGAETVFRTLVERLDPTRWESIPVVPRSGWLDESLRDAGASPVRLASDRSFDAGYLTRLVRLLRKHRVDLIQTHLFGAAVYGNLAGRVCGLPVVSTFHGSVDVTGKGVLKRLKFQIIDRSKSRAVFVSSSLRDELARRSGLRPERSHVIHNGIDPNVFNGEADGGFREDIGVAPEDVLVGAVGNLRPAKDYELLLRAAALLRREDIPYRFVIVGEGKGRLLERLRTLRATLGLEDVVVFAGFREDVPRVMADLDIYLLTSSSEGFSLSTVQALASRLPVVATRCGGPEEIISNGEHGLLVEPGRPEAVADAIRGLARSPHRAHKLARAGRRLVEEKFTVDRMVEAYGRLYEGCL